MDRDRIGEQHSNGVHVHCQSKECRYAGKVERWHSHDYDGPLVCGCEEVASV